MLICAKNVAIQKHTPMDLISSFLPPFCSGPSVLTWTESLNHSEQEEHGTDITPPAAKHVAAGAGHQDDWPHEHDGSSGHQEDLPHERDGATLDEELDGMKVEFIGSRNRVYCNYHPGLTGMLSTKSRLEFKVAKFLFTHAEMPAKKINTLLDFWAALLLPLGSTPLFANHKDLYHVIDCMSVGTVQWENFKIQHKCNDEMDFLPYQEFDGTNEQRHWENFMLGDWAWNEANQIICGGPSMVGATLVPIILGSDKTTVSIATGQMDYYPLYLSIGNVHNTTHCAHHDAVVLIAFLAMLKCYATADSSIATREHASTQMFHRFKKSHIADYEEQALLLCIMHNWCPKCLAHWEDLDQELAMKELDLQLLWVVYGIDGDVTVHTLFTSMFPRADIHKMLSPDILHQLIKGGFKDHLVDWVERYLIQMHGKSAAEKVLDKIDKRIAAVALFAGL
ncbi:hypothetical protein BKA83DRAFT_4125828 [Pisolithus microcarpus]|nr:hypothetical protein BKA83DRAFT_4125828 [Pisolithus microcarpus]